MKINVMDKIWDRSQRSLAVVAGMKKTEWPRRTGKLSKLYNSFKSSFVLA